MPNIDKIIFKGVNYDIVDSSVSSYIRNITQQNINNWNSYEANVQSDWNQTNSSNDSYIKNKPVGDAAITDTKLKYDTLSLNGITTIADPNLSSMGLSNPVEVAPDWANYLKAN